MKICWDGKNAVGEVSKYCGGKAKNLAFMQSKGLPVPAWFALSCDAFSLFKSENNINEKISEFIGSHQCEDKIKEIFLNADIPHVVIQEVRNNLRKFDLENSDLAIRSSGMDEDSATHSFAGLFSSYLFQKGIDNIMRSLKLCWASAYSDRAISYRKKNELSINEIEMGVVFQKMVNAEIAGVMFSRHPIKILQRDLLLVSAVWGLGEGLVSGELDSDEFEVNRSTREVTKKIAKKTTHLGRSVDGGLESFHLPEEKWKQPCLDKSQLDQLADLALTLEEALGSPQDIEWAIEKERLYLVQTRPITNIPSSYFFDEKVNGIQAMLWDNSNIIESYSGVTTPLTFSFASRAYNQVYLQFMEVMGVPKEHVERRAATFRNLLGLIQGRIYYNLVNWYELVLTLPGTSSNKGFMETMMGVKQSLDADTQSVFASIKEPPKYGLFARMRLIGLTLFRFINIDSIVRDFFVGFNQVYELARSKNLRAMSLPEQIAYYSDLEDRFIKRWKAPIINDYLCMVFFGLLKNLTTRWLAEGMEAESLQNDLLCGEGGLDSTEPTKFLMLLAKDIDQGDPGFRSWFLDNEPRNVLEGIRSHHKSHDFSKRFELFLDKFGFRCINELKLEEPDLHDDPLFIINSLRSYIKGKTYHVDQMQLREQEIRSKATKIINERLPYFKKLIYKFVLNQARKAVKNRENLRFARTKSFGISRHLFRAIGGNFKKLGLLSDERDIFYLTIEEIIGFVEGRVISRDLAVLTGNRKKEYSEYRRLSGPPERFISHGALGVSHHWPAVFLEADLLRSHHESAGNDPNRLFGTPCSPGIVEGVVRVVHDMKDAEGIEGQILVTARTDPGWVPLFPSCSGLLIERGSLLSHSAVVARELGLPTIVGVSGGLLQRLKNGDRIRMDAGTGEIRIL